MNAVDTLLRWWPLGALDTGVLAIGALFMAQALNLAWERREIARLMSEDERSAGCGPTILFVLVGLLWATSEVGIPAVLFVGGIFARWFVVKVVSLADAGRIGATWDNVRDDFDDDED
jgi:hypothetical protein